MYALAARMHRLQLEAALWKEPARPTAATGAREEMPPPLPTPPAHSGARSASDASVMSRRSYNIFTHQWEERPIGGARRG